MLFKQKVKILSLTRGSDIEKNGDDQIFISMLVENVQNRIRYAFNNLDMEMGDEGYLRILKAFREREPITFTIETIESE